jgi:TPR repeat protein
MDLQQQQIAVQAVRGHAHAQFMRAQSYMLHENWSKAMYFLNLAIQQGHRDALYSLAVCLLRIDGKTHLPRVMKLLKQASMLGSGLAAFHLGMCYARGWGVPLDAKRAVDEFQFAASVGVAEAQFNLGHCLASGYGIQQNYTMAAWWFEAAAGQGVPQAHVSLGLCYAKGRGKSRNFFKAVKCFVAALSADDTNTEALYSLGRCSYFGLGMPMDRKQATELWTHAERLGSKEARMALHVLKQQKTPGSKNAQVYNTST